MRMCVRSEWKLSEGRQGDFYDVVGDLFFDAQLDLGREAPEAVDQVAGQGAGRMGLIDLALLLAAAYSAVIGIFERLAVLLDDLRHFGVMGGDLIERVDHQTAFVLTIRLRKLPITLEQSTDGGGRVRRFVEITDTRNGFGCPVMPETFEE